MPTAPIAAQALPLNRATLRLGNGELGVIGIQSIKLAAPSTEDIADLLRRHWSVDQATALRIAVGSGGCVRAALADLESWLDAEGLS